MHDVSLVAQWLIKKKTFCSVGDVGLIPGLGRSPGGGHGTPLQCSCLGNPMDWGAWRTIVHGGHKESDWATKQQKHAWCNLVTIRFGFFRWFLCGSVLTSGFPDIHVCTSLCPEFSGLEGHIGTFPPWRSRSLGFQEDSGQTFLSRSVEFQSCSFSS